jgi:uroporphyrinogen decarboxylase
MRQAGRYLPEYRELRARHSFREAMQDPTVAAEITLQPLRRFPLDAAIVFADIMTPLGAMGIDVEFAPGPRLMPLTVEEVARLPKFEPEKVDFVAETIARVRITADPEVAVIGFAGGPLTVLAYLLEGSGSQHWPQFRRAIHDGGKVLDEALAVLGGAMRGYFEMQIAAGADVVQIFDTWAGQLATDDFEAFGLPVVRDLIEGLEVPAIYFAPAASHLLDLVGSVGADALSVDWRHPLGAIWDRLGADTILQGNLDPSVLLSDLAIVRTKTERILAGADRPGHIFNLGHGVLPDTAVAAVEAVVETVVHWRSR